MKINMVIVHNITFSVQAFWNEEGGMGQDSFGPECDTLNEALVQLDLAFAKEPDTGWVIVCDVAKQIRQEKQPA